MKTSPGITLSSDAQSLWLPYYINQDNGILAQELSGANTTGLDPKRDPAYLSFMNQVRRALFLFFFCPDALHSNNASVG